ncbi:MAG: AbgT family transporter [Ardenticatenaceae bacterium]|nr:AbgT family transporter [Anaerolineales bacterium]MCB8918244.1 AbgT family transporter [Ardenticatenaceae bacterium]
MSKGKATANEKPGLAQKMLDGIEKVGNKVPHPVLMFLYLIIIVMALSHVLYLLGVSVTEEIAVPVLETPQDAYYVDSTEPNVTASPDAYGDPDFEIKEQTIAIQSLLTVDGLRFIFTSFVANFASFSVVAVILVAMVGVGVAEEAGLMGALIRKIVKVTPAQLITFILIFVGVLSSVATDAGYLILIPLGAIAFLSVGRHPLAGVAAAFGGVSAIFAVNILIAPVDAMLTEITNEAILLAGGEPITIVANFYFAAASTIILSIVAAVVTTRIIEPRLGAYQAAEGAPKEEAQDETAIAAEARGLRYALYAFLGILAFVLLLTLPSGAPLRDPQTGAIIGNTPFMTSLIFIITLMFLFAGIGYGIGAKTISGSADIIKGVTKTFASLSGLIFMLLMISQFIAFFNFSNMPQVVAIWMAEALEKANIGALPLLIGFVLVIMLLNFIIPNVVPKWAIFAPIFIPVFMRLSIAPQTVLAAYRVGDSPTNVITPLMVYLPFVLTVVQRYQKDAGIGTVIALMLPYTLVIAIVWVILFVVWFLLGLPLGPGYPVGF